MENTASGHIESLFERFTEYVETRINLYKLQAVDKSSNILSSLISTLMLMMIFIMFFFMINIGIAFLLGELLGKPWYGFFVVAGFYLIIGIIINYAKKKWIKETIANKIIQNFLK